MCNACGLGLLLETHREIAPHPSDAFLVVDSRMTVQAMSIEAERLLGTDETVAIDQPVTELLVTADSESGGTSVFAQAIGLALSGERTGDVFVRPWNTFGIRMRAQVAPCGPPQAALLVLQDGAHGIRLADS